MPALRLLLSLSLLLVLTGCPKKEDYPLIVPIGFLPPVIITPSRSTMHRGDTLWLEASFSDSLLDKNSGRRYRVRPQDLDLRSFIYYTELVGIGQQPIGIARTFRLVEEIGHATIDGSSTGSFQPEYDGHTYRARIGLIPTRACITSIVLLPSPENPVTKTKALDDFLSFIQLPLTAEGRQQKAVLDDSFYVINDGQANNFDLFRQYYSARSFDPGVPDETIIYEQKSTFTIEVK
ncbi:hypothetical protein [uncultured Hymenobacter sp.]|uniref:hypothetical protein n=1 Tax=uncultured Hymenobacter sp. TaxID=170016 RepID=UPI0035CA5071